jgi:hypothetical protein
MASQPWALHGRGASNPFVDQYHSRHRHTVAVGHNEGDYYNGNEAEEGDQLSIGDDLAKFGSLLSSGAMPVQLHHPDSFYKGSQFSSKRGFLSDGSGSNYDDEIDDWSCSLVLRQTQYNQDDLDEAELAEFKGWEQAFSEDGLDNGLYRGRLKRSDWDTDDEEDQDEPDADDEGYYGKSFKIGKSLDYDNESSSYGSDSFDNEKDYHLDQGSASGDEGDDETVVFRSKYEFGSTILPFCSPKVTTEITTAGWVGSGLVCPEVDVVKMTIEMLLGYPNDIFSVITEDRIVVVDPSMIAAAFPKLKFTVNDNAVTSYSIPSAAVSVTPLGQALRLEGLSMQTFTNLLNRFADIGTNLLMCRQFVADIDSFKLDVLAATDDSNVVESIINSQHACVLYLLNNLDCELAKLDALCLSCKGAGQFVDDSWNESCRYEQAQENSLFSVDIPAFEDDRAPSGRAASQAVSCFKLFLVCQGWESLLRNTVSFIRSLFALKAVGVINDKAQQQISGSTTADLAGGYGAGSGDFFFSYDGTGSVQSLELLSANSYASFLLSELQGIEELSSQLTVLPSASADSAQRTDTKSGLGHGSNSIYSRFVDVKNDDDDKVMDRSSLLLNLPRYSRPSLSILFFRVAYAETLSAYITNLVQNLVGSKAASRKSSAHSTSPLATYNGRHKSKKNDDEMMKFSSFEANKNGDSEASASSSLDLLPRIVQLIGRMLEDSTVDINILTHGKLSRKGIKHHRAGAPNNDWNTIWFDADDDMDPLSLLTVSAETMRNYAKEIIECWNAPHSSVPSLLVYCAVEATRAWIQSAKEQAIADIAKLDETVDLYGCEVEYEDNKRAANSYWRPHVAVESQLDRASAHYQCPQQSQNLLECAIKWETEKYILRVVPEQLITYNRDRATSTVDVILKPMSDLLLHSCMSGIISSRDSCNESKSKLLQQIKAEQGKDTDAAAVSAALFGSIATGDALTALANHKPVAPKDDRALAKAEEPVAPFIRHVTNSQDTSFSTSAISFCCEPHFQRELRAVGEPILSKLANIRLAAARLLLVDYALIDYFSLLQDVFLLRNPQVFQYIKDMVIDESFADVIWSSEYTNIHHYDDSDEAGATNGPDKAVHASTGSSSPVASKHISYNLWQISQSISSCVDGIMPDAHEHVISHHSVVIDTDTLKHPTDDQALSNMPLILVYATNMKLDFIFSWPVRAIVTVPQLATYNKCMQVSNGLIECFVVG